MSGSMDQKRKRELASPPPSQGATRHQDSTSTADTPTVAKKACAGLDGKAQTEPPRSRQRTFIEDRNPALFPRYEVARETMPPTITEQERLVGVIREYTDGTNCELQKEPDHQAAALFKKAQEIIANDSAFKQYCSTPQDHIAKGALAKIAPEVLSQRLKLDEANKDFTDEISYLEMHGRASVRLCLSRLNK